MTKVGFISLGCCKNLVDTEVMLYNLHAAGFEITPDEEEAEIILETGLMPSDRMMVHLSLTFQDAYNAGSERVENPLILAVDVDKCFDAGYDIGKAGRTVVLCKMVPADCLRIIHEEELND